MKNKTLNILSIVAYSLSAILFVFAVVSLFFNVWVAVAEIVIALAVLFFAWFSLRHLKNNITEFFSSAAKSIQGSGTRTLSEFVLPIMVTNSIGEITWYNDKFRTTLLGDEDVFASPCSKFFTSGDLTKLEENGKVRIDYNERKYLVYVYNFDEDMNNQKMYFFIDDTINFKLAQNYRDSRPCIMFIHVDGLDLLLKNELESQKTEIRGEIEKQIELVSDVTKGYLQKVSSTRYLLVTDNKGFEALKEDKFSLLSNVRNLNFGDRGAATLSIGVGLGGSLKECVEYANNALDMAHGRGGDQAVIKNKEEFSFFGGVAQAQQINSRVRTRVIATTLKKLIENSENVLVMGHAFSDMDSFGAAYALCSAVQKMGKSARVVADESKSLATDLIALVKKSNAQLDFMIRPETALNHITPKTLLIIVDTHRSSSLESKAVYEKASSVVIIDHHRQTVDFIDDSLLFYHDPSASSACEMVTELLQYMGSNLVSKQSAEALLAGISLDTRHFAVKTGTRTFEASGFLRSCGANPIEVRKLFADTLNTYTYRASIVANAMFYGDFAVSICPDACENPRIASAQAADELLTIKGVDASFVMYESDDVVNISGRSLGVINVQLIAEDLGGGGHQTMAAAQLSNVTLETAKRKLLNAIEKYKSSN